MICRAIILMYFIGMYHCIAQSSYTSLDTSNTEYRNYLKALYKERSSKTISSFNTFTDKNFRKTLTEAYTELNSEFMSKVNDGHFPKGYLYEQQINILIKRIIDANPQFSALKSAQVVISFAESPNAFAMGDGFIVVNIPLVAKLNNEHELAFIICHEFAHNLLNHPQNGLKEYAEVINSPQIKKRTREIDSKKYNKAENASSLYRTIIYANRKKHRQVEFQADSLGFVLYKNAFPNKESIALKCLTSLDSIDEEKDSLEPADYKTFFSSDRQPFKEEWIINDEISSYKYDKTLKFWQIDSLKTHPDCLHRAERLKEIFKIESIRQNGENANFQDLIKQAGYDHILGLYVLEEYGKSLYEALLLLKHKKDDAYLRNMVYSNLIKIQESQKNYTMNKYVRNVSPRYSYSYNRFLLFLRQLRKSEITEIINQYSIKL